jgi:hypothetical protein
MKNAKISLLLSIFFIILSCSESTENKEEFQGCITYLIDVQSHSSKITTEQFKSKFGDTLVIYYKKGKFFKEYLNGNEIHKTLYLSSTNCEYTKLRNRADYYTHDCSKQMMKIRGVEKKQSSKIIRQLPTQKVIIKRQKGELIIWFNESLWVDSKYFKKNISFGSNLYFDNAEAMWLKYINRNSVYTVSFNAIKIERKKIDDSLFELSNLK